MKASKIQNLGLVVGRILADIRNEQEDYDMDGSGECGRYIARAAMERRERIVQEFGFANLHHFSAVVEKRTTYRWCYFSLLPIL